MKKKLLFSLCVMASICCANAQDTQDIPTNSVWGQTPAAEYYPIGTMWEEVNCSIPSDNDLKTDARTYFRIRSTVTGEKMVGERLYKTVDVECIDGDTTDNEYLLERYLIRESGDSIFVSSDGTGDTPQYDFNWAEGKQILYSCYGNLTAPIDDIQSIELGDNKTYEYVDTKRPEIGLLIRGIGKQYYGLLRDDMPSRNGQRRVLVKFVRDGQVVYQREAPSPASIEHVNNITTTRQPWNAGGRLQPNRDSNGKVLIITSDGHKTIQRTK